MLEACILYNQIRASKEELAKSKDRLEKILEATNDGFWDWTITSNDLFVSPSWVKFVTGEDVATSFYDLARIRVSDEDLDLVESVFGEQINPQNNSYEIEYRLNTFDGKTIWVEERGRVIEWSGDGQINRLVGTFKNITLRKMAQHEKEKMEAQLQHVQRLKSLGVMAGGVSHDYNNMLATIIGNTEFALLDIEKDSPAIEFLEQIQKAAYRSSELTRQLLNYSGGGKLAVERISLNSMITETLELVKASLSKKAKLTLSLDENLPCIEGDVGQIRQVLMNLIINASDSLGGKVGKLSISTTVGDIDSECHWLHSTEEIIKSSKKQFVSLIVRDTGSGIKQENVDKIFEPFFSTKTTGRGLGLASVIGIIKSHSGGIKVSSEVGVGTEFCVQLPAINPEVTGNLEIDRKNDLEKNKKSGTIIIADDEEALLLIMTKIFTREGYTVLPAPDGKIAMDLFEKNKGSVDLLLLDCNMPEKSGVEVLTEIRKSEPVIPVILLSGFSKPDFNEEPKGVTRFVSKPFSRKNVLRLVDELINKKTYFQNNV